MSEARWELRVTAAAQDQLERLPVSTAAAVLETLGSIAADRRRQGKPLRFELGGCWSTRRGPYRVVYRIDDDPPGTVFVLAVTHRLAHHR